MSKKVSIVVALIMVATIALSACAPAATAVPTEAPTVVAPTQALPPTEAPTAAAVATEAPTAAPAATEATTPGGGKPASEVLVCEVTDTGGIDDKSFNATAWKGVEDAMQTLGVQGKYLEFRKSPITRRTSMPSFKKAAT